MLRLNRWWTFTVGFGSAYLGFANETLTSTHPFGSKCQRSDSVSICAQVGREIIIPPHIHATTTGFISQA